MFLHIVARIFHIFQLHSALHHCIQNCHLFESYSQCLMNQCILWVCVCEWGFPLFWLFDRRGIFIGLYRIDRPVVCWALNHKYRRRNISFNVRCVVISAWMKIKKILFIRINSYSLSHLNESTSYCLSHTQICNTHTNTYVLRLYWLLISSLQLGPQLYLLRFLYLSFLIYTHDVQYK